MPQYSVYLSDDDAEWLENQLEANPAAKRSGILRVAIRHYQECDEQTAYTDDDREDDDREDDDREGDQ